MQQLGFHPLFCFDGLALAIVLKAELRPGNVSTHLL